jgi:cytochrome d ubiquinol oxidase subunit II
MSLADVCVALIAAGMAAYITLGGADFGGGFWDLTAGTARHGHRVRALVQRSMGPVWETNHVWLIFVLVVSWTAFPVAFGSAFSTLYVALFLAAAGIILRGTAFALRVQAATIAGTRTFGATFAIASVLTPFFLGAAAGAIGSGRVPVGNAAGDPISSWLNPTSIAIGVLAVLAGAYLAAVYLAADAREAGLADLQRAFRARALGAGVAAGAVAAAGLVVLHSDARALFDGLTSGFGVVCVAASAVAGVATLSLVWRERYEAARFAAAAAVAAVTIGWVAAQYPDLLPGQLTVQGAAAPDATLVALLVSIAVGLALLIPSLVALYRLSLQDALDEPFEDVDRHFRPADER